MYNQTVCSYLNYDQQLERQYSSLPAPSFQEPTVLPGLPVPEFPGSGLPSLPGLPGPGFPGSGLPSLPGPGFPGSGLPSSPGPGFPGSGLPSLPGPGFPGSGLPGLPGSQIPQAPTAPPPPFIPQQATASPFAVDPGAIRLCLFRNTFIWLNNGEGFWFYPIFVGPRSVAGFRWNGWSWTIFGIDTRRIMSFTCY